MNAASQDDCRSARVLLDPIRTAILSRESNGEVSAVTLGTVGSFNHGGREYDIPRLTFIGPDAAHDPIRLGLFAGLHGDEPAGCTALVQFGAALARNPALAMGYELMIYPVLNPTGYERATRVNYVGKDLNREFWRESAAPEIRLIEAELRAQQFAGIITLHADDTCEGIYGYAHGRTLNESLLKPALAAASRFLPLDGRATIDGFAAREGLIHECFQCVLSAPPDQHPQPFDLIFETPAHAAFDLQVSATVAAVEAIIAVYPGFISYAQDL
jgi:hypothetical protein